MSYDHFMYDEAFEFHNEQEKIIPRKDDEKIEIEDRRLPPLGACSNEISDSGPNSPDASNMQCFQQLQEQHDEINASLFALTSHFAQVQFRLKQIINGPKDNQEKLLSELEEFAFAGCPDVVGPNENKVRACSTCVTHSAVEMYEQHIADEKEREKRLDTHLKKMIADLESCQKQIDKNKKTVKKKRSYHAFSSKDHSSTRQSSTYTFNQLNQLDISDDETDYIPTDDIKQHIDESMAKLINPKKAKENIISQVSKQISDMEKFVTFLKGYESTTEVETDHEAPDRTLNTSRNSSTKTTSTSTMNQTNKIPAPHTKILQLSEEKRKRIHEASIAVVKKGLAVLQIFAISQFGCSARHFQEHMMRKAHSAAASTTGYMKPLDMLRSSIDQIMVLHTKLIEVGGLHPDSEDELNISLTASAKRASWSQKKSFSRSRSRTSSVCSQSSVTTLSGKSPEALIQDDLVRAVRGNLATTLKELLQHGLCQSFESKGLSTKALVGCILQHSLKGHDLHIWEYFRKFYHLKHGDQFNLQPSMMLSEAFGMDVGCTQQTPKQSLLTVIHRIRETHVSRKRSFDSMFKALISAGLNRGRLAQWIRLVIRCPELVDRHYERWSYVISSGFDDVLTLLEKLSSLIFFLPEDLAIRHLLKSTNEFGD